MKPLTSKMSKPSRRKQGPERPGFNFTLHMRHLLGDVVTRLGQLEHIDLDRVAVSFHQTRKAVSHGMYASLTPMRFANGRRHTIRRGQKWAIQQVIDGSGREMLYILSFYLPRFLQIPCREKLSTVVHELWHISPRFDGDLRRHGGRCYAHGSAAAQYDAQVERLVDRWLQLSPPESVYRFLEYDYHDLVRRHGRIYGQKIPNPKLFPVG